MIRILVILPTILFTGICGLAQNLGVDLGKANQILKNTSIFSIEFRYSYYATSVNEEPVLSVKNKAYRYFNGFCLDVENKNLIYQDNMLLTKDNDNGVFILENAENPINEMLSPQKLMGAVKDLNYSYTENTGKKIYTITYPKNNKERLKEVIVILNAKNCFFMKAQFIFSVPIGKYIVDNKSTAYSIMEVSYLNFRKDDTSAKEKTQLSKYIRFVNGKAVVQQTYSRYAISDIRKKNKTR